MWAKMNETGGAAKALFEMGVNNAKKKRELAAEGKSNFLINLKVAFADKVVFKKIRDKFGGRLVGALTASALMNVDISNFFTDIGIPVFDCYGLSETSPAVSMNCFSAYKTGSVGKPIDDVKVVIDKSVVEDGSEDGEIVVYGPNVHAWLSQQAGSHPGHHDCGRRFPDRRPGPDRRGRFPVHYRPDQRTV